MVNSERVEDKTRRDEARRRAAGFAKIPRRGRSCPGQRNRRWCDARIGVAPAGVDGLVRGELGADARLGVVCSSAQSCYAHERTGDALLEDCEGSAVSKGCHATCSSSARGQPRRARWLLTLPCSEIKSMKLLMSAMPEVATHSNGLVAL